MKKVFWRVFVLIVGLAIIWGMYGCQNVNKQKNVEDSTPFPTVVATTTPGINHEELPSIQLGSAEQLTPNRNDWICYWIPMMMLPQDDDTCNKIRDYSKYQDYNATVFLGLKDMSNGYILAYDVSKEAETYVMYCMVYYDRVTEYQIANHREIDIIRGKLTFDDFKDEEKKSAALEAIELLYKKNPTPTPMPVEDEEKEDETE